MIICLPSFVFCFNYDMEAFIPKGACLTVLIKNQTATLCISIDACLSGDVTLSSSRKYLYNYFKVTK